MAYLQAPPPPPPRAPANAKPAALGARVLDAKQLHALRTNIWALRVATPLVFVVITVLAAGAITKSNESMLIVGAVWVAVSWPLLSWSIWKHRVLSTDLDQSAIVVQGGMVTSAKSVAWGKRSTEAVVGYLTFRITRIGAYAALRRTHGTAADHVTLAIGIGVLAGIGAWALAKRVVLSRAAAA